MKGSSINTALFGVNSVCGATASAAVQANAPIDEILPAGDWSSAGVFNKHNYRESTFLLTSEMALALTYFAK